MMKESEARILVFLEKIKRGMNYGMHIAAKLEIDYKYCLEVIGMMTERGWILRDKYQKRTYYILSKKAPLKEAKLLLGKRK